jgi:hypothetical protein
VESYYRFWILTGIIIIPALEKCVTEFFLNLWPFYVYFGVYYTIHPWIMNFSSRLGNKYRKMHVLMSLARSLHVKYQTFRTKFKFDLFEIKTDSLDNWFSVSLKLLWESPNRSLQSPLSSKNTNLATTAHEIRKKGCKIILYIKKNKKFIFF